MISPAKRHFMRVTAEQESAAAGSDIRPNASQNELLLAQLYEHKRQLKALQSIKAKRELKAQLLPDYTPYIEGVLAADAGGQDDVLMTVMVWGIDAGAWHGALQIAEYALKHDLALPDQYQRTTACVIAEEVAEAAINGEDVPLELLQQVTQLVEGSDMPDQVRAKLHKAQGLALIEDDPQTALNQLKLAVSFHDRAGVKKEIERLERQLKKQPAPDA